MNISSSTLFRFMTKPAHLEEVLSEGFGFRPCTEEIALEDYANSPFKDTGVIVDQLHSLAICFCDLPLGQTQGHRTQYGEYAIGMTKEWAMRQQITPVRYYHSRTPFQADANARLILDMYARSQVTKGGFLGVIREFMNDCTCNAPTDKEIEELPDSVKDMIAIIDENVQQWLAQFYGALHFTRIYEGRWEDRSTGTTTIRKFYDEREWRAITFDPSKRLGFEWRDVDQIIVNSAEEQERIGELVIQQTDKLKIGDTRMVWSKISIGSKIYPNV
jgi:hypothetical protein